MHPICLHIFGKPVYWYGVMMAMAFLAAVVHWTWLGRREQRPPAFGSDLALWVMAGGIIGARLNYVAANPAEFLAHPLTILRLDQGGLIFYGGLLGGAAAAGLLALRRRENPWWLADFVITALPLGHFFGRIGCFLNGCCYGKPGSGLGSYMLDHIERYPVQLYEAAWNLLIYLILTACFLRPLRRGAVIGLYLVLYPLGRFGLEFLRGDPRHGVIGLTAAQIFSLVLLATGVVLLFQRYAHPSGSNQQHG